MKSFIFLLFPVFFLFSCEKENQIPASEIPGWLKDQIAQDAKLMESDDRPDLALAAWIRFQYHGESYFEYHNPLLSSGPPVYDWDGNKVYWGQENYLDYENGKCCKRYIWYGSSYFYRKWPRSGT